LEYTDRLGVWEVFAIDLVHRSEIIHVDKEDVDLDRLGEA